MWQNNVAFLMYVHGGIRIHYATKTFLITWRCYQTKYSHCTVSHDTRGVSHDTTRSTREQRERESGMCAYLSPYTDLLRLFRCECRR